MLRRRPGGRGRPGRHRGPGDQRARPRRGGDLPRRAEEKKYDQAYELLCEDEQRRLDLERFTSQEQSRPERIQSYELGEVELQGTSGITLPVTERYTDGDTERVVYRLAQDPKTTDLEVCGRE
ncbi:hypothetical protein ACFQZ4_17115 [Catellatospora coxensis]